MPKSIAQTHREVDQNDPLIEALQIWRAYGEDEKVLREIRILAFHPMSPDNKRYWIYENTGGGLMKTRAGELGKCPEFNLRYVFRLVRDAQT